MAATKKARSRKSGSRKYGAGAAKTVASAMRQEKKGTLRSSRGAKGGKVTSRKQAIVIGLSEARKKGAKVPKNKSSVELVLCKTGEMIGGIAGRVSGILSTWHSH